MGVPKQEQPVKIWGVAGQTSWTKGDFPRRREEQTALGRGSEKVLQKKMKSRFGSFPGRKHGRTAERLRGKRELNAYLRSAAGETNVQRTFGSAREARARR
ncbi:hypothetical protein NDU88_006189 [Pleurodeles waltl]|uniref:Uncharacterized protein n=1 Tax=Pleurodeles waltl TaxID=8319 RepID=A0AAV7WDZ7_PLEWA|nr:hypothetical protein NDU88_006189 [Pleurodeles waltl]